MPASAPRIKMPANNRVHSSRALQTHAIWSTTIGHDPYAGAEGNAVKGNVFEANRELLDLAKNSRHLKVGKRGSCKKCGEDGHLTYMCRNFLVPSQSKLVEEEIITEEIAAYEVSSTSSESSSDSDSAAERRRRRREKKKRKKEERKRQKRERSKARKKGVKNGDDGDDSDTYTFTRKRRRHSSRSASRDRSTSRKESFRERHHYFSGDRPEASARTRERRSHHSHQKKQRCKSPRSREHSRYESEEDDYCESRRKAVSRSR